MVTKQCFKCGRSLSLDNFYTHKAMKDGYLNKCKECTKKDVRDNHIKNYDHYRQYDIQREKLDSRKKIRYETTRRMRDKYPEKTHARQVVDNAKRRGHLIAAPCEICGSVYRIEAHHEDYSKPLEIIWLCRKHHNWIHA